MGLLGALADNLSIDKLARYDKYHPVRYGLPDLAGPEFDKRPGELWITCWMRRHNALKKFVEENLRAIKGSSSVEIILIEPQIELLTDCFWGADINGNEIKRALVWKNRGGGGSLVVAILIWLKAYFFGWSALDFAGSGEQAKQVYSYTTHFWSCVDGLEEVLDGEPRKTMTDLKTGASIQCLPASDKQARSKHCPLLVIDEACQEDPKIGEYAQTAAQAVFSEKKYLVVWVSTFHIASGYFQRLIDGLERRKIKMYYWNCFHTMEKCTKGIKEYATEDDPLAYEYCKHKCELTRRKEIYNEDGEIERIEYQWCNGIARTTNGYQSYDNILDAKIENEGTEIFHVEHAGNRPESQGPVYKPADVNSSFIKDPLWFYSQPDDVVSACKKAVGIDWGIKGEGSIVGPGVFNGKTIEVPETFYTVGMDIEAIQDHLIYLKAKYGEFNIWADSENQFNIVYLRNRGWRIKGVSFRQHKETGIGNTARWLATGGLKVDSSCKGNQKLKEQLLFYYRDKNGKPIKENDHGPDALMCMMMEWNFVAYHKMKNENTKQRRHIF